MRCAWCLAVICTMTAAFGAPAISWRDVPAPSGAGAVAPGVTAGPDGTVWLSWVEPGAAEAHALRAAAFDAAHARWHAPVTIAAGANVAARGSDIPQLAVDGHGTLDALWIDGHGGAWFSQSRNRGRRWTTPQRWVAPGLTAEKFATVRLADGRVLAAWLQAQTAPASSAPTKLMARIAGIADQPDEVVDPRVCDCCQLGLAPLLDTGVLLVYRGLTEDNTRDIHVARRHYGHWTDPRVLNNDDWHLRACPINGPRIGSDGSRAAAAWYTAAGSEPRVLASFSPDAATRWLMPLRLDRGKPVGHVETIFLRDGAFVVCWTETDGSLWLRRVTPEFTATDPVALAPAGAASTRGFARASLIHDYTGGHSQATVLVAYTAAGPAAGVHTVVVDIPEGELVDAERNCTCAPTTDELQGFPIRGTIRDLDAQMKSAQIAHEEVPGVFERGTHVFGVAPTEFPQLQRGRQFLGRVTWRNGAWRLFDIRLLTAPAQ